MAVAFGIAGLALLPAAAEAVRSTTSSAQATTATGATTTTTRPPALQASISPNVALANQQVVTVSWSGFHPTSIGSHTVGIFECKAKPVHFDFDCYLNNPFALDSGDANAVWNGLFPSIGWFGVTAPNGTGSHNFKVLAGTLLDVHHG